MMWRSASLHLPALCLDESYYLYQDKPKTNQPYRVLQLNPSLLMGEMSIIYFIYVLERCSKLYSQAFLLSIEDIFY